MKARRLLDTLRSEATQRVYIRRVEVLAQTEHVLKARLVVSPDLFIQVYRNDRFETTNLALIYNGQRIYGRDQLDGKWHRHALEDPDLHDFSDEGSRSISISEFLDAVEVILATLGLP